MFVCVCLCVCVCDFTWIFPMQIHLYTNNRRACFYVVNVCVCVCACVVTCCAASPLTMWGRRGTSPFRRGGGAKSSGIWSVIIIVTYIHGEIHWTALPGKVQRQRDREKTRVECWSVNYYCHVYAIKLPELIKGAKNCENDWQLFSLLRLFTNLLANVARL